MKGPTILRLPVNFTVIWRFLLSACKMIHSFSIGGGGKIRNICTENTRRHHAKFSHPSDQASGIRATLVYQHLLHKSVSKTVYGFLFSYITQLEYRRFFPADGGRGDKRART